MLVDALLNEHIPAEKLAEVKRVLYGNPVGTVPISPATEALAAEGNFEVKAFSFPSVKDQLREPRVVRVGVIQHSIVLPTTDPVDAQYFAMERKIERIIDAAAQMGVNVLCLQETWRTLPFSLAICVLY